MKELMCLYSFFAEKFSISSAEKTFHTMVDRRRGIIERAFISRPEDVKESLFFVNVKKKEQTQGRGIACAVQTEVRGQTKYFLLTDTDVKTDEQGRVFAHRCYRSIFKPSRNVVDVGNINSIGDASFSFIPLDGAPKKSLKLISDNIENRLPMPIDLECRSFVATQKSLKTVYWEYNWETQRHQLKPGNSELQEPSAALGSPVLWKDGSNQSYVVGVIRKLPNGIFFPDIFNRSTLQHLGENINIGYFMFYMIDQTFITRKYYK